MENIQEFDKLKTKVLKYIMYKKRTEREIRQKFRDIEETILEEVIEDLKELDYINDSTYIERSINEFIRLNNLSVKEISYKLMAKGLKQNYIQEYIDTHKEELYEYENKSARNIFMKKSSTMEDEDIIKYLGKKGYKAEAIKGAMDE